MKNFYSLSGTFLLALIVLVLSAPSDLKAQTTLAQGDISIIGFNSTSPARGVCFVTWVNLSSGTVIKFSDSGFNSSASSTAAGNSRWQEQEVTWTATSAIAAGTVIRTTDMPPAATTGTLSMTNADGAAIISWGLSNGGGDQIFAYQSSSLPAFSTTSTFTGTIISGLGYQGTGANTNWLSAGSANSNSSWLPGDLVAPNHIYLSGNALSGQYTGARSGQPSLASYKTLVNNPANWTVTTASSSMTTINLTPFTVAGVPNITSQPSASTICAGANTSFSVTASNANSYQWQVNTGAGYTDITNGGFYSGTTTATLSVNGAVAGMSSYLYRCVVTGPSLPDAVSNGAALTVISAPSFASNPSNSTICAGANTSFSASAVGSGATHQWQVNTGSGFADITNGGVYSGATGSTLTITGAPAGMNGYQYRCVSSGACSPAATSSVATLTVNSAPSVTSQPSGSTICAGANTSFSVTAAGATGYQWQVDNGSGYTNVSNGGAYSGATTSTLTVTGATAGMSGYSYRCIVTGACTPAAASNGAALIVNSAPSVTSQPSNSTICAGANTSFSVTAAAATGYQWQVDAGSGFANITNGGIYSNATTATLSITGATAVMSGYSYQCVVSGACAPAATSSSVALTVNSAPSITSQPSASTICAGANTSFSIAASNATGYQWQLNTGSGYANITNGGVYSGATSSTLTITGAAAGMNSYLYQCIVSGSCAPAATSNGVALTVNVAPAITAQPSNSSICLSSNASFSVTATGATGYQWQEDNGSGFANITNGGIYSGATTATLTLTGPAAGMDGYLYRCIATGTCTPNAASNEAALTIGQAPAITAQSSNSTICAAANTFFSITATGATGYQWQVDNGSGYTNVSNGGAYSGATTSTLTVTGATAGMSGYSYRCVVSGSCAPNATSNSATLTVNPAPAITAQPSNSAICAGGNTTFSITATGATGYQWQEDNGSGFADITNGGIYSGATTATLTLTDPAIGMSSYVYRCIASGICSPAATSGSATLTVNTAPLITSQPSGSPVCVGLNTAFSVTASNATGYQWQVDNGGGYTDLSDGGAYSGAATATLTISGATAGMDGYIYRCIASGACSPDAVSDGATLTVNPAPAVTSQPSNSSICAGSNTAFSITATGATGYQWQVDNGSGFADITNDGIYSGATTAELTITEVTEDMDGYSYRCIASGTCAPDAASSSATLTVNTAPSVTAGPVAAAICPENGTTFSVTATGSGLTYQWQVNAGSGFTDLADDAVYSGSPSPTLTITGGTAGMNGYSYQAIVTGTCAPSATSASAVLTVNAAPVITADPADDALCAGENTLFSITASDATGYQWQVNDGSGFTDITDGGVYSGAATSSLTITAATASLDGNLYQCVVTGACAPSATSDAALLEVNVIPAQPAAITGDAATCTGETEIYSVANDPVATAYNWTLPASWTGTSTSGSITAVAWESGDLSVTASNECGVSASTILSVTVSPVYDITVSESICDGDSLLINGVYELTAGTYTNVYSSVNGCDSTVTIQLSVNPVYEITTEVEICEGDSVLVNGTYILAAGTYTSSFQSVNSCDSTVYTVVSMLPSYNIGVSESICSGDSIFLQGAYQTTGGVYTDEFSTGSGCDSTITTTLTIMPTPVVTFTVSADTVCEASPLISLEGSPAGGIFSGEGVSGTSFDPESAGPGTHVITYTVITGECSATESDSVVVEDCLGVDELSDLYSISVYPNPHKDLFNLKVVADNGEHLVISMTNELGQYIMTIYEGDLNGTLEKQVHTEQLPSGVYFLTLTTAEGTAVKRIVK